MFWSDFFADTVVGLLKVKGLKTEGLTEPQESPNYTSLASDLKVGNSPHAVMGIVALSFLNLRLCHVVSLLFYNLHSTWTNLENYFVCAQYFI